MDSASPSQLSDQKTPTVKGEPLRVMRRAKPTDPLRPRKKPIQRTAKIREKPTLPVKPANIPSARGTPKQTLPASRNANRNEANGGWSHQPDGNFRDFPLLTTAKELREGIRYHIAKFASKNKVDPENQDTFTRPITLQRRQPIDPRDERARNEEETVTKDSDSKAREKGEILKAQKEARKAAEQAQIAPVGTNALSIAARKAKSEKNSVTENYVNDKTPAQKKQSTLRFEESYAWYLDDHDGKNQWMGLYTAALSECNVAFIVDGASFRVLPIEKWYKFVPKGTGQAMTVEEVEAAMAKKVKENRWTTREKQADAKLREAAESRQMIGGLYTVKKETATFKQALKGEHKDMDDLDFDADDLFQDDDDTMNYHPEKNEEEEEAKERIKRDQLGANLFELRDEHEVDKEEEEELRKQAKRKAEEKNVKKALRKVEGNYFYDDDSDQESDSGSDTSDTEKLDKKQTLEKKSKADAEQNAASGTSSKGSNMPKHSDAVQKASKNLKRAASPNLSESSANEITRKKAKKKHTKDGTSTPTSTPRLGPTPVAQQVQAARKSSVLNLNVSSPGSSELPSKPLNPSPLQMQINDEEVTGGEMSDGAGGKKSKIKIRLKNRGSPGNSRAGSPGTSRAASPAAQIGTPPPPPRSPRPAPQIHPADILAAVVVGEQLTITELSKRFKVGKLPGQVPISEFVKAISKTLKHDKDTKTFSRS